jgi:hypothetical protein
MKSIQQVFDIPAMSRTSLLAVFRCPDSDSAEVNESNWKGIYEGWTCWWKLDEDWSPDGIVVLITERDTDLVRVYAAPGARRIDHRDSKDGRRWKLQAASPFQYLATIPTVSHEFLGKQMPPGVTYIPRKTRRTGKSGSPRGSVARHYDPTLETSVLEHHRLVQHLKRERNPKAAAAAKAAHGTICQACNFDFESVYGSIGAGFIEAHHLVPIASLKPGQGKTYNAKRDFAVLCSNCHRMFHRPGAPSDLKAFRRMLKGSK